MPVERPAMFKVGDGEKLTQVSDEKARKAAELSKQAAANAQKQGYNVSQIREEVEKGKDVTQVLNEIVSSEESSGTRPAVLENMPGSDLLAGSSKSGSTASITHS